MGTGKQKNDEIELLRDAVVAVVAMARKADGDRVKLAMDILLAGTSQLGTIFQRRCGQQVTQKQPRKEKPPKSASAKAPKQPKRPPSSTDNPDSPNDSKDRPKALSSIQQGILQADTSLDDQQRNLRHFTYGQNDDERSFRLAAKAIAS